MNHPGGAGGPADLVRALRLRALERRDQRGLSLAEVLVTIAVISILFVAVAAGLTTSVKAGAATDQQQRLQAKLTSFTEGLRSLDGVPGAYVACVPSPAAQVATPAEWETRYEAAASSPAIQSLTELGASVTDVTYWNGTGYSATCPATDLGSQLLTVEVADGDQSETGQVVVRTP